MGGKNKGPLIFGVKTKYDYLKASDEGSNLLAMLSVTSSEPAVDRIKKNRTIYLSFDGKLSVVLIGATVMSTFMEMGAKGNLKGAALEDYLNLKAETPGASGMAGMGIQAEGSLPQSPTPLPQPEANLEGLEALEWTLWGNLGL